MAKPLVFKVPARQQPIPPYDFPQGFSGGINISVAPDQISPNQSPDIENMNYDDGGIPTKRYGFAKAYVAQIGQADEFLIIHGGNLYKEIV
jgi:CTP-dependent riboflavin kinase